MNELQDQPAGRKALHWWFGWQRPHPWPLQIAVSLALAAIATLLTMWVAPAAPQFTYGFYYAAVLIATLYSGLGAGILTTALSVVLCDYFFVRPPGQVLSSLEEMLHALSFVVISGLICALVYLRTQSEARLHERERFIENLAATAPYTLYLYDVPNERIAYVTTGNETDGGGDKAAGLQSSGGAVRRLQAAVPPSAMLAEDQIRYRQHVSDLAAMPPGSVLVFQHRIQTTDGEWRWYERQEQVYDRLEGGAVYHLLGVAQDITDRKGVEDRVRYQAQLLDSVDQAIITVDLDNRVTYWNQFAESLYGWSADEVLGKTLTGLLSPPSSRPLASEITQRLRNGQSWSGEIVLQRRDGSTFFADVIDAPIYDENGALAGIMGVSVDTSERKRAETYLQFLADASLELTSSLDYKTTIQRVADLTVPRLADWCGVDLLRADGSMELVAVAHVDPDKVRWAQELRRQYPPTLEDKTGVAKVIKTGEADFYPDITPEMIEQTTQDEEALAILRKVGMRSLITVPLRARSHIIGALTLVWSESNRRYSRPDVVFAEELANRAAIAVDNALLYQEVQIAEQQQAELLAQMESLVANAPIGIAFLDRELRYVRVNDALAQFNGLPVDAHLEHRLDEVMPQLLAVVSEDVRSVLETGQPILNQEISGQLPVRPGEVSHFLVSWYPVVLEGGKPQYLGTLVVDITERKRIEEDLRTAEAQLRQLNESLEDRVVARTQELERSNRELDRFAYVASHDLKAPLRAIDNLSTWVYQDANDLLPSPSQEHLQKLRGRVRRMERLLDDLLAYSRAGRVQHMPQEVDCGALVRSIYDLLSPPPDFRLTVHEPMPVISTQRVPLETVLRNLLGNAIKHHNRTDGHVQVSARWSGSARDDGGADKIEFSVQDDGPGMAAEYHERIFELFQTLQPRDQVEGSGMGLAIVKKTVESVGGSIVVESSEGIGTCFRFTWPVKQTEELQSMVNWEGE